MHCLPDEKTPLVDNSLVVTPFVQALTRTHTSVGEDELLKYTEWTEEFGEEGA